MNAMGVSMKRLVIGMLARVDAGKTTLSEAMLYLTGEIKRLGRVDHGDAFLDTFALERERGITIFSKQALFSLPHTQVTLLDTPGHIDFSAETERVLQVLDYAVLIISGTDGVEAHTQTLWRLLERCRTPTFIFVNKMDLPGANRSVCLQELTARFGEGFVDCSAGLDDNAVQENIAMCDETLIERFLDGQSVTNGDVIRLTAKRRLFPCFFGSALRLEGISALLDALDQYTRMPDYSETFGARVFKIAVDGQNNRLTYMKLTGGALHVRDLLCGGEDGGWQEKVNQLRVYSGAKYQTVGQAEPGMVCAATGLSHTRPGAGLGAVAKAPPPILEPVLTYRLLYPPDCDAHTMLQYIRLLEQEDPQLQVSCRGQEIYVQLMGEIQLEVLTRLLADRFGVAVQFDEGSVIYKETIAAPAIGIGHFEPLRHYAEVQLLLEPGERGDGLRFSTACPLDVLGLNWQRLILTHLAERQHIGVCIGAPITDVTITLLTGRAHVKHTEGGDFREATYRAVRNGLMQTENIILEPYYAYELEIPESCLGRAIHDMQSRNGTFSTPTPLHGRENMIVIAGIAPVVCLRGYTAEVAVYTKGMGRLRCTPEHYRPCHNPEQIIAAVGYNPENDPTNTPDSVFCSHGAGHIVKWDEVASYAHTQTGIFLDEKKDEPKKENARPPSKPKISRQDEEAQLRAIFERTYGPIKDRGFEAFRQSRKKSKLLEQFSTTRIREDDYLLVDGYNIIFSWDELRACAEQDINIARDRLLNILSNYQSIRKCHLIVVFDAYKVKGGVGSSEKKYGLDIIYTKEAETADMYIEQASYDLSRRHRVRVATSDGLEQIIILGHGAERLSASELQWEVKQVGKHITEVLRELNNETKKTRRF